MIFCAAVFDIGTSSLKGALIAEDGKVYTQGRLFFPQNLEAETWLISFENLFKQFSDFAEQKSIKICGICISGNGPSLVAVSEDSAERDFLLLWNKASSKASHENSNENSNENSMKKVLFMVNPSFYLVWIFSEILIPKYFNLQNIFYRVPSI